jgi:ABC-type transport system involved in cytochrome bd biosynthesis fused ATPase/permease subunit
MSTRHIIMIITAPLIIVSAIDGIFILIGLQAHRKVKQRRKEYIDGMTVREYGYQYRQP